MNFYILYLFIPILLYIIRPVKNNKVFALFLIVVCILSYDNVSDYYNYIEEFDAHYYNLNTEINQKGREPGWYVLNELFCFSEYGLVAIHSLILIVVSFLFVKYSKRLGLLNISLLLYFIMNLVTLHDNILRQDIAMIFTTMSCFEVLKENKWNRRKWTKLILLVVLAFLFHFPSLVIVPFFFLIRYFSKIRINFWLVLPLVIVASGIAYTGIVAKTLGVFFMMLSVSRGDFTDYYATNLMNEEGNEGGLLTFALFGLSLLPLFYFTFIEKGKYRSDKLLRLCVNLSWLIMSWKYLFASVTIITRIADYLVWFALWGYAYMFVDLLTSKKMLIINRLVGVFAILILSYYQYVNIRDYYGDNVFQTIMSDDCRELRLYDRSSQIYEFNATRIRK